MEWPGSVEGVVEVQRYGPERAPALFIELPHGATREVEYRAVASRLKSALPDQLEHFFFVNTDVGTPEGAKWLAEALASLGHAVVVARCLIPRTFIDTNRVVALTTQGVVQGGLTAAIPGYVDHPADLAWLGELHARYHQVVERLYAVTCGDSGSLGLQLHSYSPRSVGIERVDRDIVKALHAAYVPEVYATWPERPSIDFISATADGSFRTAPQLVDAALEAYRTAGLPAQENATYHLAPAAQGYVYAQRYPRQVICLEMNRGLIADPFVPFGVSSISEEKVAGALRPLLTALTRTLE